MEAKLSSTASTATTPRAQSLNEPTHCELTFDTPIPAPYPPNDRYPSPPKPIQDPLAWSGARKAFTTVWCCSLSVLGGYATGASDATLDNQGAYFGLSDTVMLLGLTAYGLGFAASPMLLAPFSEVQGRKPVFLSCGFVLAIASMGCGVATSFAGFVISRLFAGLASATFSTMIGGVVTDMYDNEDRNGPMAIFAGACFVGTGSGPLFSMIIAYHIDWRYVYYVQAIAVGLISILSIFVVPETRQNVLLSVQAEKLHKWQAACEKLGMQGLRLDSAQVVEDSSNAEKSISTPTSKMNIANVKWFVGVDEQKPSLLRSVEISVIRPCKLLFTEPIVFWFAMWIAFAWSVMYFALAGVAQSFAPTYNFNKEQAGAVYAAIPIGAIIGALLNIVQDKVFHKQSQTPEDRLRFATIESLFFPIGLFMWAWTCNANVPWIVPVIGLAITFIGVYTIFLAVLNYTADVYHLYASSALAAQSLVRNILGATFPLAGPSLFRALTIGGALSFLGGVALLLSAVPVVLLIYGGRIRARSKIASEILETAH